MKLKFFEGIFWIFVTSVIYFSFGVTISKMLDYFLKKIPFFDNDHKKNRIRLVFEVSILIGFIATSIYLMRLFFKQSYPGFSSKFSLQMKNCYP